MGQREGFSDTDIRKVCFFLMARYKGFDSEAVFQINTLYQCSGYKQVGSDGGSTGGKQTTTQVFLTLI